MLLMKNCAIHIHFRNGKKKKREVNQHPIPWNNFVFPWCLTVPYYSVRNSRMILRDRCTARIEREGD